MKKTLLTILLVALSVSLFAGSQVNRIGGTRRYQIPRNGLELWLYSHTAVSASGTWLDRSQHVARSPVLAGNAVVTAWTGWVGDGGGDYADLLAATTPFSLVDRAEITMLCWVYTTSRSSRCIYHSATSGDYWRFVLILGKTTSNRLDFQFRNTTTGDTGTIKKITANADFSDSAWMHVAVVYSVAAGTATLYQNGSSVGTNSTGITAMTSTAPESSRIGARGDGTYSLPGKIDAFAIYSRALTQAEIQHIMVATKHN